jgi:transcriptional regulator with XRE-family HTH domain
MKYETFANRLGDGMARIRREKGFTQAHLAREAGLSLKYVSMIESGTNPSLRTIFRLCDALGTSLEEVLEAEGITTGGRKPRDARDLQLDVPVEEPSMKRLVSFIRRLDAEDRRRALRLVKTTFDR